LEDILPLIPLMPCLQQPQEGAGDGQLVMADSRQQHSWRLVWCHEHVFKQDKREEVAQLTKLAGQFGGMTICVKQACKLEETLSRCKNCLPFVLMTDFRGLVPCLKFLESNTLLDSPLQMVVLCQQHRQVVKAEARASQWVNLCMRNGHVFEATVKSATSVLEGLMMTGAWPLKVQRAARALPAPCNPKAQKSCRYISFEKSARAQRLQQASTIKSLTMDNMRTIYNHGSFQQDPILMHTHTLAFQMPLEVFIKRLLFTMDPNNLKTMLEDATPMVYLD